jgi:hypothetical protein
LTLSPGAANQDQVLVDDLLRTHQTHTHVFEFSEGLNSWNWGGIQVEVTAAPQTLNWNRDYDGLEFLMADDSAQSASRSSSRFVEEELQQQELEEGGEGGGLMIHMPRPSRADSHQGILAM